MSSGTLYTLVGILVGTVALIATGWRLAAQVTRWADEVRDNTQATRSLARKHGRLAGRVRRLEDRVKVLER